MTVAQAPSPASSVPSTSARLELAWTLSAAAVDGGAGYSSAVLHMVCEWDPSRPDAAACTASVVRAAMRRDIDLPAPAAATVTGGARWRHVTIRAGRRVLLTASFEGGRLVYCTSELPAIAGLRGGTYDAPTGLLEFYGSPA